MYLSVTQLENDETITTGIRLFESMTLIGIRLRLYKHGSPDGTVGITLKEGSTVIGTTTLEVGTLNAAVGTYFHGYVLFETDSSGFYIQIDPTDSNYKELSIEISLTGHTNDEDNYIGLTRNFASDEIVDSYGTIPNENDMTFQQLVHFQPYGIELYKI
jgi:hypothetical protein